MARISKKTIAQVREQTDIVRVIGEYVKLEPRGKDYWGCCPFHQEKTASFHIEPDKGFYYCFSCHASGDAITFLMEEEKLAYTDAIVALAKKENIPVLYDDEGDWSKEDDARKENERRAQENITLYERVAKSFHFLLTQGQAGKAALQYLHNRGLTDETIEKFRLGYAPTDKKWLGDFLKTKGYSADFLHNCGLFSRKYPDMAFFRDRVIFPIFNRQGKVVAFGGRDVSGKKVAGHEIPKYLNSGDLPQYKKGETLFAFNFAKNAIRDNKRVIFCEGYMDCIAYHQCGVEYAVAPLGTSLTEEQIKIVKPFVETVFLSFDNDSAGTKATERAIQMVRRAGLAVRVILITGGKDPAELVESAKKDGKNGKNILTNLVESAIIDDEFLLSKLKLEYPGDSSDSKIQISKRYFSYVNSIPSAIGQESALSKLSVELGLTIDAIKRDWAQSIDFSQADAFADSDNGEVWQDESSVSSYESEAETQDYNDDFGYDTNGDIYEDIQERGPRAAQTATGEDTTRVRVSSVQYAKGDIESKKWCDWMSHIDEANPEVNPLLRSLPHDEQEMNSMLIIVGTISCSDHPLDYEYVTTQLHSEDFEDTGARALFDILCMCFKEGSLSIKDIDDKCNMQGIETNIKENVANGVYSCGNEEVSIKNSVDTLRLLFLKRQSDKIEVAMKQSSLDKSCDAKMINEMTQQKAEIDTKIQKIKQQKNEQRVANKKGES